MLTHRPCPNTLAWNTRRFLRGWAGVKMIDKKKSVLKKSELFVSEMPQNVCFRNTLDFDLSMRLGLQ
jgi:hypothetical protein